MRKAARWSLVVGVAAALLVALPWALWSSLTHQPKFYQAAAKLPRATIRAEARHFAAQSLQLRNDIANEPNWEAAFTDREVNAWLAEDLVRHFAAELPREVHEPRVSFEADRVVLAFGLDQGPIRSMIWVVARVKVVGDNTVALTLEKIRAGVVPISAESLVARIDAAARDRGLDIRWSAEGNSPVATLGYETDPERSGVVLERIRIEPGAIRLAGRSNKGKGRLAMPILPGRKFLQSRFPSRKVQRVHGPTGPDARNSALPAS